MPPSRRLLLALVVTALAAGGGVWYSRQGGDAKKTTAKPGPVPVTVARAESGEMPLLLNTVGRAEAWEGVTLKSRVDGQVVAVAYADGQAVKKGEVLLQLDPNDFAAKVAQAEAVVARDEAQLAKARADVERYAGLKARGFVSDEKLNEMRTNEMAVAATLKADRAALDLARLQLSYTTIRAPFSGVVGARLVFPGSAVKTNDTALAVVNRVDPLQVSFSVPERHLGRLRQSLGQGPLTVQLNLPGSKGEGLSGKLRFIDNAVDQATGTIVLKAVVDNPRGQLTPGQFLNVSATLERLTDAVLVPNEAVQQGPNGNFLYVAKADDTAEMRKIEVLASHQGKSAIGQGLAAGETVVTDGQLRLTPGAAIRIKEKGGDKTAEKAAEKAADKPADHAVAPAREADPAAGKGAAAPTNAAAR
ncbi:efflux RND transporter periplasmic adaptor subunit [Dechloromonas sp. ZY10]|uniref:efflux RND transporter periplasmic adaptor subunit n=1 Tax=Dechloromonas aquae TaxID=2664436 RepID=UPI00352946F0